jgi:hypothetical protein
MVGRAGLLDARHFLSSGRGYPLTVSSVIKYKPGVEEDRRLRYIAEKARSFSTCRNYQDAMGHVYTTSQSSFSVNHTM